MWTRQSYAEHPDSFVLFLVPMVCRGNAVRSWAINGTGNPMGRISDLEGTNAGVILLLKSTEYWQSLAHLGTLGAGPDTSLSSR
jgi:hypothetical protein